MSDEKTQVEGWAIVDLMGHLRMGGYVSEVDFGGSRVGRIDVPAEGDEPASTHLFGGQSIYRLTFCTEEVARMVARKAPARPIDEWDFRMEERKRIESEERAEIERRVRREIEREQMRDKSSGDEGQGQAGATIYTDPDEDALDDEDEVRGLPF